MIKQKPKRPQMKFTMDAVAPLARRAAEDATLQKIRRANDAMQAAEDAKLMGELGKPFLIQLNADMEKAVEETRIIWGMKSRAQAIRVLIGKGIASLSI